MARWILLGFAWVIVAIPVLVWLTGERGRVLLPSTRRSLRQYGRWRLFTPSGLHFWFYGCFPRKYIGLLINKLATRFGRRGKKYLADHYHGKVLTREQARSIIEVDRKIPARDLEQVIPYPTARSLVLHGPPDIAVLECPCRLAVRNPCQPTQVCLIVGQPFVDLVLDHHPNTSRPLTQSGALDLLEAEYQRGHVHSAWFKDVCLNRFFAICNCCSCCCGGINAMVNHGIPMMASSGYVAEVDRRRCTGCGACQQACAFRAIQTDGQIAVVSANCMGCGVCTGVCREQAIRLRRDTRKPMPLDVRMLA
jgi:Pyruvate/2-oxoacid:ferredoxin oxidoreductase delta subunit